MVECFAKNMANKFCHSKSFTWIQHFFLSKSLIIWIPSFPLTAPTPLALLLASCGINHTTYRGYTPRGESYDSMSVYEGGCSERTHPSQTPVWSNSLRVVLRSGWYWDAFWKRGRAAATHQHPSLTWITSKRALSSKWRAHECAQVRRAALGLLTATFWTFWTYLDLFVNTQTNHRRL